MNLEYDVPVVLFCAHSILPYLTLQFEKFSIVYRPAGCFSGFIPQFYKFSVIIMDVKLLLVSIWGKEKTP